MKKQIFLALIFTLIAPTLYGAASSSSASEIPVYQLSELANDTLQHADMIAKVLFPLKTASAVLEHADLACIKRHIKAAPDIITRPATELLYDMFIQKDWSPEALSTQELGQLWKLSDYLQVKTPIDQSELADLNSTFLYRAKNLVLHLATEYDADPETLQSYLSLLEHTKSIQLKNIDKKLFNACKENKVQEAQAYLLAGANPNIDFQTDWLFFSTALEEAVKAKKVALVKSIVNTSEIINKNNINQALSLAVHKKDIEIMHILFDAGANPNTGLVYPALHQAVEEGNTDITQALIDAGADVNLIGYFGRTALHYAVERGSSDTVQALIKADADLNLQDCQDRTALADVNLQGIQNRTALHYATERGHTEIAQALIDAGADLNLQDNQNRTALHYAAINNRADIGKALIGAGADLNLQDDLNHTAYFYAIRCGTDITEALTNAGADIDFQEFLDVTTFVNFQELDDILLPEDDILLPEDIPTE